MGLDEELESMEEVGETDAEWTDQETELEDAEDDEDADCRHDDEFTAQALDHIHGLTLRRRFFHGQDIVLPSLADDFNVGLDGFELFP